jgi:hypothetical protein
MVRDYKSDPIKGRQVALLDALHGNKTQYSPLVAKAIINKKDATSRTIFPQKIDDLFNKIASDLKIELP